MKNMIKLLKSSKMYKKNIRIKSKYKKATISAYKVKEYYFLHPVFLDIYIFSFYGNRTFHLCMSALV